MKIGVYGGSFNPPHLGHLQAAREAVRYLKLDRLLLIPTGLPPHKQFAEGTPSNSDRLKMTELMGEQIALETGIEVQTLDVEMQRAGKSYTADTMRSLRKQYPADDFWLFVGTDMFLSFQNWYRPAEILSIAGLCAFARNQGDGGEVFQRQASDLQRIFPGCRIAVAALPEVVDISSTELREALQKKQGQQYLTAQIYGYILRKHLYGTICDLKRLTIEELRPVALSYLKAKRVAHVLGTEQTAVKLAEKYGADPRKASIAALLHDCTKRLSMEEQQALCKQYGIALDALEQKTLKLLHAKTGAAIAQDVFGVDDEIYQAIFWHTTGKADMTRLEKVIYLADYIEPTRDFPGVQELRQTVWEDLDRGLLKGLTMTVEEMEEMGNPIHQDTILACNFLRGKENEKKT